LERTDGRRSSWKWGCSGCAAVAGVFVALLVVLAAVGWLVDGAPAELARETGRHDVPFAMADDGRPSGRGRIVLNVAGATLDIVPGPAGVPILTEVDYDATRFDLTESFREGPDWSYELSLVRKPHFGFFSRGETDNRIRIVVPRGVGFRLEGQLDVSTSRLELGGLSLTSVDLATNVGTHELRFGEPSPVPMERLAVENRAGRVAIVGTGNASPVEVEISQAAGRLDLDLRGAWRRDATVRLDCKVGAIDVRVAADVRLDVDGPIDFGDRMDTAGLSSSEGRAASPTLRLELDTRLCTARVL